MRVAQGCGRGYKLLRRHGMARHGVPQLLSRPLLPCGLHLQAHALALVEARVGDRWWAPLKVRRGGRCPGHGEAWSGHRCHEPVHAGLPASGPAHGCSRRGAQLRLLHAWGPRLPFFCSPAAAQPARVARRSAAGRGAAQRRVGRARGGMAARMGAAAQSGARAPARERTARKMRGDCAGGGGCMTQGAARRPGPGCQQGACQASAAAAGLAQPAASKHGDRVWLHVGSRSMTTGGRVVLPAQVTGRVVRWVPCRWLCRWRGVDMPAPWQHPNQLPLVTEYTQAGRRCSKVHSVAGTARQGHAEVKTQPHPTAVCQPRNATGACPGSARVCNAPCWL